MTGAEIISGAAAVSAGLNLVGIGVVWGTLRSDVRTVKDDVASIKRALGLSNGQPGLFVRKTECSATENAKDEVIRDHAARLRHIETGR